MQRTVDYTDGVIRLIDQTRLPDEFAIVEAHTCMEAAEAIRSMVVRGAPAIGVTAALGVALAARESHATDSASLLADLHRDASLLRNTRPTAVNLFRGIDRMLARAMSLANSGASPAEIRASLDALAGDMIAEDENTCRAIGANGAILMPDSGNVLTHCNAGALACVNYGTALGVIRAAVETGKSIHVYAGETRPRLQGMKLTCYELMRDGIPVTLISDSMAGSLMRAGKIDCVVVGADRIASNGDSANKIGTYSLAVLARHHGIAFYVAAPVSTIDFSLSSGDHIPIEERAHEELTHIDGARIAPEGVEVYNPSFDVTPARLVTAIVTEKGIAEPPYNESLRV